MCVGGWEVTPHFPLCHKHLPLSLPWGTSGCLWQSTVSEPKQLLSLSPCYPIVSFHSEPAMQSVSIMGSCICSCYDSPECESQTGQDICCSFSPTRNTPNAKQFSAVSTPGRKKVTSIIRFAFRWMRSNVQFNLRKLHPLQKQRATRGYTWRNKKGNIWKILFLEMLSINTVFECMFLGGKSRTWVRHAVNQKSIAESSLARLWTGEYRLPGST